MYLSFRYPFMMADWPQLSFPICSQVSRASPPKVMNHFLSVFRSGRHIYAQIIDDEKGQTLAAASSVEKETRANLKTGANIDAAKVVGKLVAERALGKGITDVVFDRGGYRYHGHVRAFAEALREAGLVF